jgi:HK97 family phage major capsid protein
MKRKLKKLFLPVLRGRKLALAALVVVAVLFVIAVFVVAPKVGLLCMAAVPLLGMVTPLTDDEFQTKVLKGVEDVQKEQGEQKSRFQKVTDDLDRADKEVKKAIEELTKVKNTCNDFDVAMKSMRKVQQAIASNANSSFRDPVAKALDANEGLGEFINAAARAAAFPNEYGNLPASWKKMLEEARASSKALTGVDASLGQATIPSEWFKTIYDTLTEYGDWTSLDVIRVGARTNLVPVATARPGFYWIGAGTGGTGEGSAITEGAFTGDSVTLSIQTLAVYLLSARELLADSSVDMAPYLTRQLLQSIAFGLDTAAFIGAGTADQTNAGYYGIFNAASVNTNLAATTAAGNTTIGATQLEDWQNAMLTVSQVVLQRQARWWMNPQNLIRALAVRDKNGRPLFQTYTEAPMPGGIGNILGYPVKVVAVAPSTDVAGATVAAFGDPQGQAIGLREDMEFATSDDIKFAENMRAFRALCRAGVKLKTKAASNTLKPISVLTLAAA